MIVQHRQLCNPFHLQPGHLSKEPTMPKPQEAKPPARAAGKRQISSLTPPDSPQKELVNSISIDNVIFGLDQGQLKVLLVRQTDPRHRGLWALPGGWIKRDEDLRNAASRVLADLTGLHDVYLEQLKTFGRVDRFPFDRVITVAYYALVNTDQYPLVAGQATYDVEWHPVANTPVLVYDHSEILSFALDYLKDAIRYKPIAFALVPKKFTLNQLQGVYEAVLGKKLDKPNFRRKLLKLAFVKPCREFQQGTRHRAAQLFRFDEAIYKKHEATGFTWMD